MIAEVGSGLCARPATAQSGLSHYVFVRSLQRKRMQITGSHHRQPLESPAMIALSSVRACLTAGAADHIVYAAPQVAPRKPRRQPRWPSSNGAAGD
jgi:hypothetical protein